MRHALLMSASILAFGLGMASAASAADAPAPADQPAVKIEEIVITAQKRTERLQDVPVAASVLQGAALAKNNVSDISDLNNMVPSVQLNGTINGRVPMGMRGVSTDSNEAAVGVPSGVAIMIDGVPVPSDSYAGNQLEDVQSVEVLKGPQGTLGGRTAAAGVINMVTRGPTATYHAGATVTITDDEEYRGKAYASGPINDKLQFSLAGWDGKVTYPITNIHYGTKTYQDTDGLRAKLKFMPTDNLDMTLMGRVSEANSHGFNFVYTYVTPGATLLFPGSPLTQSLLLPGITLSNHNLSYNSPVTQAASYVRDFETSLTINYHLGETTLSSTTAYLDEHQRNTQDLFAIDAYFWNVLTGGHAPPFDNTQTQWENVRQVSEELKLVSPAGKRLSYVVGAFFSDTKVNEIYFRNLIPAAINTNVVPDTATYDLYGRATLQLLDATSVVAGLRYNYDDISYNINQTTYVPQGAQHSSGTTRQSTVVGDISLQQKLTPNAMVYGTYARGYSPSVYNTALALADNNPLTPVAKETVDDFEIGTKGSYFDRRLTVDASVFYTNYDNYQIQEFKLLSGYVDPPLVLENGGARTQGVEVDTVLQATRGLRINFDAAWIDAKFTRYPKAPCYGNALVGGVPTPPAACFTDPVSGQLVQNATGKTMPNSPKFKFVLGADERIPLSFIPATLTFGGDYAYRTSAQMLPDQNPQAVQKGFGILNLNAGLQSADKRYAVTLFVNNVFDKTYYADMEDFWNGPWANFNTVIAQPARDAKRYFGVRFSADF